MYITPHRVGPFISHIHIRNGAPSKTINLANLSETSLARLFKCRHLFKFISWYQYAAEPWKYPPQIFSAVNVPGCEIFNGLMRSRKAHYRQLEWKV